MKILIAAIGRARAGPEQQLAQDYLRRIPWKTAWREMESKNAAACERKSIESALLLDACKGYAKCVALDESGASLSSVEFARTLRDWQNQGASSVAFMIGGSDGLDSAVLQRADLAWSLGRVTWPHMLVRALLAEQLYRAHSVLSGHPYHRE